MSNRWMEGWDGVKFRTQEGKVYLEVVIIDDVLLAKEVKLGVKMDLTRSGIECGVKRVGPC